jgi:exonuclease VII small subunit
MFVAALKRMILAYQELNDQSRNLASRINDMKDIENALRMLSGMEQARRALNKCIQDLEQERYTLIQMLQVLEKAVATYSNCEQRIIGKYEESVILYRKTDVGFTDLNTLSNVLSDIKFIS